MNTEEYPTSSVQPFNYLYYTGKVTTTSNNDRDCATTDGIPSQSFISTPINQVIPLIRTSAYMVKPIHDIVLPTRYRRTAGNRHVWTPDNYWALGVMLGAQLGVGTRCPVFPANIVPVLSCPGTQL